MVQLACSVLIGPRVQPLYRRSSAKAAGESRASENIFNLRRALRHVRGVLQQPHVAGHERGRGEANHLPEGVVPGHHGRNRPQRRGASAQSPPVVEFFQPEFLIPCWGTASTFSTRLRQVGRWSATAAATSVAEKLFW